MSTVTTRNLERSAGDVFKSREHAAVGMKAFFNLKGLWRLKNEDAITLLGAPSQRTFFNWKSGKVSNVSADTMRRIGYLLGIHKALRLLFRNPENVYGWVSRDNEETMVSPNPSNLTVEGSNLSPLKARLLLMAALMRFGSLPAAVDSRNPTPQEKEAVRDKIEQYQEVFSTH